MMRDPMPDPDDQDAPKNSRPAKGDRMPPPLSTDLIAKLREAVDAARRKRLPQPREEADPETDE